MEELNRIEAPLSDLLGIRYPIIMAPMFLVSNTDMIIEAVRAGITGAIPALNYRTTEELRNAIQTVKKEVEGPFGINLIVNASNFLYKDQQFEAALGLLNRLQPSALVLWLRGVIYQYHMRDFILACETYVRAITMNPKFAYSYYSLAKLLSEYGDTHTSDFVYRRCLAVDICHYMARLNRAIELDDFDLYKTAELKHVISINPTCEVAKELLAKINQTV